MSAARISQSTAKLSALEGLRGILALTVCCGHLGLNDLGQRCGFQVRFDLAVDVFFALSGFVLSRAYYLGRRSYNDLVVSRIARLYPLHLLTLLWCLALSWQSGVDWPLFIQNLGLVHNIGLPPNRWAFDFPSWSISVEMVVSLAFFAVMLRAPRFWPLLLLAAGIAITAFETASGFTPALNHAHYFNSGLMRGLGGFALGSAAYLITLRHPDIAARMRPLALPFAGILAAIFLVETWWWAVGLVFALAVFLAVLCAAAAGTVPLLSSRPFVWLGAVSYSVYLLHIPLYWSSNAALGHELYGAEKLALLAAVLAAAHLTFRYFELPMQRTVLAWLNPPRKSIPAPP